ncbi:MAG: type IV pilus modification PilV family protein [Thermodesulfobacteriota bacterium]
MNRKKYNHRQDAASGYTLIEVLIAIAVFSIGVLAVASMQIASTSGNVTAQVVTDLTYVAAKQMERIISQPYDSIVTTNPAAATADWIDNDDDGLVDEAGETATRFSSGWTVTDNELMNDTKTVRLTITENFKDRDITLTNVVALGQR